jgi:hypothetical protein
MLRAEIVRYTAIIEFLFSVEALMMTLVYFEAVRNGICWRMLRHEHGGDYCDERKHRSGFRDRLHLRVREEWQLERSFKSAIRASVRISGKRFSTFHRPLSGFSLWERLGLLTASGVAMSASATLTIVPYQQFLTVPVQGASHWAQPASRARTKGVSEADVMVSALIAGQSLTSAL